MNKLLILNWKMNPQTLKEAISLAKASDYKNIIITPPFLFLEELSQILKNAELGAQDVFWEKEGAFTGEVSITELKDAGVKYVIVGHSERRYKFGETDEQINKKVKAIINSGLTPILCVGETLEERKNNEKEKILKRQLESDLSAINKNLIIAYEPVWAIGTGQPETPEDALATIQYIKNFISKRFKLDIKVLYGGSVTSDNLDSYIKYEDIDGALVGGASLDPEEIKKIIKINK